ncbi:MAG TPA: hypothetical protein VFU30_00250 [Gaiellaceae bacterium]|nr:hypothetical protein [Gaiellaceae bacterium]
MTPTPLIERLPIVYRLRDVERNGELEALIDLIDEQVELLRADLDGLWDDFFIETCADWVVPYIGDLVSNTPLHEIPNLGRRTDVAETIHWRRRKGTLTMLGELARAVTGWTGTAVAMFELLGWNQNLEHLRMQVSADDTEHRHPFALDRVGTVDLRDRDVLDRVDGAFDEVTHTVDVRPIGDAEGWHGIRKVCFFAFRLTAFPLAAATPAPGGGGPGCFHVHPLGNDAPVFHVGVPVPEDELATEANVDAPIRPYGFYLRPERDWNRTLALHHGPNGDTVPVGDILCKDLSGWPAVPDDKVAVDVRTGRIRIGAKVTLDDPVTVDAAYGFPAPLGGGPYPRNPVPPGPDELVLEVQRDGAGTTFASVQNAFAHWVALPAPGDLRILILDSATYALPAGGLKIENAALADAVNLTITAADEQRPLLVGDIDVDQIPLGSFTLDGLLVSGAVSVAGAVDHVSISDCTLVPGLALDEDGDPVHPERPSLVCDEPADRRDIELVRSITGPLRIQEEANHLVVTDGIVDAPAGPAERIAVAADDTGAPGPESTFERVTVLGDVIVRELTLASDSIFTEGRLHAERRQAGCMRFCSFELQGAHTPRRYRCQPDLVRIAAPDAETAGVETLRVRPWFTTSRYGEPAYLQLGRSVAREIREGADDGAEMGAYHLLQQPFRETNLRIRLDEYLPFGLEPGIVHVT